MGHSVSVEKVEPKKFELSSIGNPILFGMMGIGALALAGAFAIDPRRAWHSYLTSYFYFASLAVGGLFFTAIQHAVAAGWSVNVRRISEAMTAFLPIAFIGGVALLAAGSNLFLWLDHEVVAHDAILQGKAGYLNLGFFAARVVVITLLWMFFAKKIVGYSVKQDADGDEVWTHKLARWSVAFIMVFALSYSLFSVDLMMSLEPHWFSTIFGVYCFAGLFQATLAFMVLMALFLKSKGWVTGLITIEHVHDLAKMLKGFTVFWAYIAFSQFMLIWYANLPEETIFFLRRAQGGFMEVSMALLFLKFVVPFVMLLPRWAKRTPAYLIFVCSLVLIMQYVDLYWIVYPNLAGHHHSPHVAFSWVELGSIIGFAGLFLFMTTRFMAKHNLVPVKDPRIHESLSHHVTY